MKKLISLCNDAYSFDKLCLNSNILNDFLSNLDIDGIELLKTDEIDDVLSKSNLLIGRHLFFYPLWMDFYNNDESALLKEFKDELTIKSYYMAENNDEFVRNLRNELIDAEKYGFEYVVMHASHMSLEEVFTQEYKYKSMDITKAFVDNLNRAIDGLNLNFEILIENNWYPGFNFLEKNILEYYKKNVKYNKLGFMLDTAHLCHTNFKIDSYENATNYILERLHEVVEYISDIKGIHLNLSLPKSDFIFNHKNFKFNDENNFYENLSIATKQITSFDRHEVYEDKSVRKIIELINPKYLVYELGYENKLDLENKIKLQNQMIKDMR